MDEEQNKRPYNPARRSVKLALGWALAQPTSCGKQGSCLVNFKNIIFKA